MGNIIDVHISRVIAGKKFPFDKVYLVEKSDAHLIGKIFGYAIVLPMRPAIVRVLRTTVPRHLSHKGFRRNDAGNNNPLDLTKENSEAWWIKFELEHDLKNRLVVVPVLTSKRRKKEKPRYLGTRFWPMEVKRAHNAGKALPQFFDDSAFLATSHAPPNDKVAPVCVICPRMLAQLQGECAPGDEICYKSLDFARVTETEDASVQSDIDLYSSDS